MNIKSTFNKSFYYSLKLREADNYVEKYSKIAKNIRPQKIKFKFKPTGLWSKEDLINFINELGNKKSEPYRFFKLNVKYEIHFQKWTKHKFIMLGFSNKYQLKSFLNDFHINKNQVAFCFWKHENIYKEDDFWGDEKVADTGIYKIVFKLDNPDNSSICAFKNYLTAYNKRFSTNSYGKIEVYDYIQLPSSIHDRWFDPFKMQRIYNFDDVYNHYFSAKPLYLGNILHQTQQKANLYAKNKSKSVSSFISNQSLNEDKFGLEVFSTRFYHKYLEDKNPYKIAKFKKDWKFAAESFIKEVYGKYLYQSKRVKDKCDVDFYNSQRDIVKECYSFKDIDKEIPIKIEEINKEISKIEDQKIILQSQIDALYIDLKKREKEVISSFKPSPENHEPEEELLKRYNNNINMYKLVFPTFDKYLKYIRTQESDKDDPFIAIGNDEQFKALRKQIDNINDQIKKLDHDINNEKSSIRFYENSDYKHKYYKMHAELNEVENSLFGLVFSKKELTLFVNSLNLKTKICPCKFRKIILDVLTDVNILFSNNNKQYDRFKCICRRYLFNIDIWKTIKEDLVLVISNILDINKLENHFSEFYCNIVNFPLQFAPRVEYADPPD